MTYTDRLNARYTGERGPLFGLAFKAALLTVITLGIYRFWAKTRIRKYIWSSVRLGNDTLEYTGTGLEKFLGFLVAVVVLAVYLGLVQLILFYFGLHFVFEPQTEAEMLMQVGVIYASFFALVPLMLFARYRARRYMLARTRWRGIRFGMDKAAWGYVWRAIGHGILTALTLGILLPRQTFWLEKYKTDRSYYGDQRFEQGGKWTRLYGAMKHFFIGFGVSAAIIIAGATVGVLGGGTPYETGTVVGFVGMGIFYLWMLFGYVYYRVHSFRYLTANKSLVGAVSFVAEPRTGRVIGVYLLGYLAVAALALAIFGMAVGITSATMGAFLGGGAAPGPVGFVIVAMLYLGALALIGALGLVFITQPIIAHFVETLTVLNPAALDTVRQRAHDVGADAEGFADALDIGAAI